MKAKKKIVEKKTGEKYTSKAAMMKHEKSESKAEMKKEYGKPKAPTKQIVDPNAKKREQERQSRMTEAQKIRERKEKGTFLEKGSKVSGPNKDSMPGKAPKNPGPARGRKEGPAVLMQLKSVAKMKKC